MSNVYTFSNGKVTGRHAAPLGGTFQIDGTASATLHAFHQDAQGVWEDQTTQLVGTSALALNTKLTIQAAAPTGPWSLGVSAPSALIEESNGTLHVKP